MIIGLVCYDVPLEEVDRLKVTRQLVRNAEFHERRIESHPVALRGQVDGPSGDKQFAGSPELG